MQLENIQIWLPLISAIVGITSAILTSFVTHRLTAKRDIENKQREQRINFLIEAFQNLSKCSNHPNMPDVAEEVENAVTIIQLFGTVEQIDMIQRFAKELGEKQVTHSDDILLDLRNSLRHELNLEKVDGKIWWLRIKRQEQNDKRQLSKAKYNKP